MAAYFQLYRRGESEPVDLNELDETLCGLLNVEPDPKRYVVMWFDLIGYPIAAHGYRLGSEALHQRTVEVIRGADESFTDDVLKVLRYLEENFTDRSWHQ